MSISGATRFLSCEDTASLLAWPEAFVIVAITAAAVIAAVSLYDRWLTYKFGLAELAVQKPEQQPRKPRTVTSITGWKGETE